MIPGATACDLIKAVGRGNYQDTKVYLIEGEPGFWRRINRDGRSGLNSPVDGAKVVHIQVNGTDRLAEVVHWTEMESLFCVALCSSSSIPEDEGEDEDEGEQTGMTPVNEASHPMAEPEFIVSSDVIF